MSWSTDGLDVRSIYENDETVRSVFAAIELPEFSFAEEVLEIDCIREQWIIQTSEFYSHCWNNSLNGIKLTKLTIL